MKQLKYICVQPRLLYYAWQVEVMLNNFLEHEIKPKNIYILVAWNLNDDTNSPENIVAWNKLKEKYNEVNILFYQDTRIEPHYISSVRPNVLKQHFTVYPELEKEIFFYHDCDIVLTQKPDFERFIHGNTWYLSNTNSYINYDYIMSKGEDVYNKMCDIVGMDPLIPKLMNSNSGGAQYIMKNVNAKYWDKVERDSEELFKQISTLNHYKKEADSTYHELQIWCADMWAVLWNAWLKGHETKVVPSLDFSWATDTINKWEETIIFHNAGATGEDELFYKGNFRDKLPYNIENTFNPDKCSYKYFEEILKTKQISCLV